LQALFLKGFGGDLAKCYAQASMVATDAVSNIRTVAAFGAEEKVLDLFVAELEEPKKRTQSRSQIAGFFYGLSQFFIFSSYGLTMYYASVLIKKRVIFGIDGFAHLVKCVIIVMFSAILLAETLTSASDVMNCGQVKAPDPFFKRVILTIVVGSYD
jgi:ATP-binding cassette subfamily B (MDR/TAP) protein 1